MLLVLSKVTILVFNSRKKKVVMRIVYTQEEAMLLPFATRTS